MFDENAQDEATITVIATGLDEHGANASVAKAMTGFTSFKTKVPAAGAPAGQQVHAAAPEAAATASAPYASRPRPRDIRPTAIIRPEAARDTHAQV